jgi:transposase-like protein
MSGYESFAGPVITADTRLRWSVEEKQAIVAEAAQTTTSVSAVAQRHGIAPSLLFRWRREFAETDGSGDLAKRLRFIRSGGTVASES